MTPDDSAALAGGAARRAVEASPAAATRPAPTTGALRNSDSGRPPGLYDLPGLLTRIWSVPAAKLATSGSYSVRPAIPLSPARELDEPQEPVPLTTQWPQPAMDPGLSLPLAAAPSLAIVRKLAAPAGPQGPAAAEESQTLVFSAETHYAAWRRPPCRMRYTMGRSFLEYRGAEGSAPDFSGERHRSPYAGSTPGRGELMPPATRPWVRVRRIDEESPAT